MPPAALRDRETGSPRISIVIPAHNEERRIGPVLAAYALQFSREPGEIIVVLNGCTDRTIDVVREVQRSFPSAVKILDLPEAIGKGTAVRAGFRQALGAAVGFVDADGSTKPEEFRRLLDALDGYDVVIGSRWMPGAKVFNRTSVLRRLTSKGFLMMTRLLFGLPYHDTQCGAKWFRRAVVAAIAPRMKMKDMTFDVETLILARSSGFRIREVPTVWTDQSSPVLVGTPGRLVQTSVKMFWSLLRLYVRARRERLLSAKSL